MTLNHSILKQEMKKQNISCEDLADRLGVTIYTISLWRNGKRNITKGNLRSLAKALNVNPSVLSDDELTEIETQKSEWLTKISDAQLASCPKEFDSDEKKWFQKGIWHGLQIAWNILNE